MLLPLDADLQRLATERGLAWVALKDPRLRLRRGPLAALHPQGHQASGDSPRRVVDPAASLAAEVHLWVPRRDRCRLRGKPRLHPHSRRSGSTTNVQWLKAARSMPCGAPSGSQSGLAVFIQSNAVDRPRALVSYHRLRLVKIAPTGRVVLGGGGSGLCGSHRTPTVGPRPIGAGTQN